PRLEHGRKRREQFPGCLPALAALIFAYGGELRKCFLESWEVGPRIIAKSARSTWCLQDFSVHTTRDDGHGSSAFRQCNRANKICSTLESRLAAHLVQQFFNPLRICRLQPGVPCGMHSGRTPESRHDQTGVIGEDQPISVL